MTSEKSTMVVVSRAALEGALRAALPHVARRIPEDRVDAARLLLDGAHAVLYQDAAVEMDPAVVRTFAASAAAWQIPLRVRVGDGFGRSSFIWGSDACLGWSAGSVLIQAPVTGELLYDGPSIPYLEAALLPPVPMGSVGLPPGLRVYEGREDL